MQKGSVTCNKRKLTNWWLGAGLLLGLLLFTGHTGKTMARYTQPVQIAWQHKRQNGISVQSYWYAQPVTVKQPITPAIAGGYNNFLLYYHRLVSVRLIRSGQLAAAIKTTRRLIRMPSFPEDPEALIFYS